MDLFMTLTGIVIYLIPSGLAQSRNHNNTMAIFTLNLFFGWSIIGWFIALIWACTNDTRKKSDERNW